MVAMTPAQSLPYAKAQLAMHVVPGIQIAWLLHYLPATTEVRGTLDNDE